MKLLAALALLATATKAVSLRENHEGFLLGPVSTCCSLNGGDICGTVYTSCCKKG